MSRSQARRDRASFRQTSIGNLDSAALACLVGAALALSCGPAAARHQSSHKLERKEAGRKEPFGNIPKGPLEIFVSINQQKLHLYSDGFHVADTSVATGIPSLPTPLGIFDVIQKQVFHRSNIYSNAPMPFMQRITWSGVALHEGESIGHRASHGCIRMPRDFAVRLYGLTRLGARVIVANQELRPADFADPHLFVHREPPPPPAVTPVASNAVADAAKPVPAANVAEPPAAPANAAPASNTAPQPAALGLHAAAPGIAASDPPAGAPAQSDAVQHDAPAAGGSATSASTAPLTQASPAAPAATPPSSAPSGLTYVDQLKSADPVSGEAKPADAEPAPKPDPARQYVASHAPISIFISRKTQKIYVRQNFAPIFQATVTIENPTQPLGTHLFTALDYLPDHATLRWNVVSMPSEPPKPPKLSRHAEEERWFYGRHWRREIERVRPREDMPPPETPAQALARITIPQNALDFISELIVPGSSLIVSDQGLGDETGEGTNFVVVTHR